MPKILLYWRRHRCIPVISKGAIMPNAQDISCCGWSRIWIWLPRYCYRCSPEPTGPLIDFVQVHRGGDRQVFKWRRCIKSTRGRCWIPRRGVVVVVCEWGVCTCTKIVANPSVLARQFPDNINYGWKITKFAPPSICPWCHMMMRLGNQPRLFFSAKAPQRASELVARFSKTWSERRTKSS